jgi:site-specific DNA recombinase
MIPAGHTDRERSQDPFGCGKTFRGAEPLEDYVTEQVLAKLDLPDIVSAVLDAPGEDTHVAELLTKLASQREHRKELLIDHGLGVYSRQDFQVIVRAADDAIALTQADLAKAPSGQGSTIVLSDQPVREAWPTASLDWKREVISLVVEKVIVKPGHPGSKMYKTWRFNPDYVEIVWRELSEAELQSRLSMLMRSLRSVAA